MCRKIVLAIFLLSKLVKIRLIDQFKQTWYGFIYDSQKCLNYRIFKTVHCNENYLNLLAFDLRFALSKLRCVNHKLPIEKGRFFELQEMNDFVSFVIQIN